MNTKNLKQILSASLSLAMIVSSSPMPARAFGPVEAAGPAFVAQFTPPEKFGYVASSFSPDKDAKAPRMILISDLHAHVEVQHNIKGILEHVVGQLRGAGSSMANKTVPIFVEGGWEPHLEEPLKPVKNSSVRSFLAEYFLHKSEINAAQSFSEDVAGSNEVSLIGVESKAEYMFNRGQFLKTYPARKALLAAILHEEAAIREVTKYLTNSTFAHLQDMRDGYNAGRVSPESFARTLAKLAQRNGINDGHVSVLQNVSTASQADLDVALSEVYRSVLRSVAAKRPMTAFLRQSIKNEDAIRDNLARIDASLDLLKRLVADQLTPSEVPLVIVRMPELVHTAELLLAQSSLKSSASDVIHDSFKFYPFAELRDATLADNSLKALESFGADATGILVTGGFHTDAIAERLRQNQISYLIIHPTITRDLTDEEQTNYIRRMGGEHVTAGEIEQDIESLRRKQPIHAQASAGVVSNLGDQLPKAGSDVTPGDGSKSYLGGVNVAEMTAIMGSDVEALKGQLETIKPQIAEAQAAAAAGSAQLEAAQQQVMDIAQKEATTPQLLAQAAGLGSAIASPDNMFISLNRDDSGKDIGLNHDDAEALADLIGGVAKNSEGGEIRAATINEIHIIGIDKALERLGTPAKVFIDKTSGARTIVIDKQRLQNWIAGRQAIKNGSKDAAAAFDRAEQTLIHELTHVFDKNGRSETATVLKGWAIQIAMAAERIAQEGGGEAEIRAEIERIITSLLVDAAAANDTRFVRILSVQGLAETIANVIDPAALSSENAQRIFEALKNVEPEETDYQIQQEITNSTGEAFSMSQFGGMGGRPPTIQQIMANLEIPEDAKLTSEDAARVVTALKDAGHTEEEAAKAIAAETVRRNA